jgi:hypothetical protein
MKAATLQNMITNEKGISDILTYSLENKCEYHAETGDTLMYFQLKDGGIGVIGVNDKGEIFTPENVIVNNEKTTNPITMENLEGKMPEKITFLSEQIKESPNLLNQFTNEDGFSRESLQQVREYLEKQGVDTYDKHIEAVEANFVDRNAIKSFNEFVTRASFMGNLSKTDDVIVFGLIKPAQRMAQMANPGQYGPVFNQACDQLIKGLSQDEAIMVAETLLVKKQDELTIVPRETQQILVARIDELQRHGMAAPEVVGLIQSYNESTPQMASINKQLIDLEMKSGASLNDIMQTKRDFDINVENIAKTIASEINSKSQEMLSDDIKNNTGLTVTGIYLSNLNQENVLLVAQQMPEGEVRDSFMIIAGLKEQERPAENHEISDDSSLIVDDDPSL